MSFHEALLSTSALVFVVLFLISLETVRIFNLDLKRSCTSMSFFREFLKASSWLVALLSFLGGLLLISILLVEQSYINFSFSRDPHHSLNIFSLCVFIFLLLWIFGVCHYFRGRLNGGSDAMLFQVLVGLCVSWFGALIRGNLGEVLQIAGLSWISIQVTVSYFIAGAIKARNRRWWKGDVFFEILQKPIYSISPWIKNVAKSHGALCSASAGVIVFELTFPLVWIFPQFLGIYLALGILFHFAVGLTFGLHRFFWVWLSTYPAVYFSVTYIHK